MGVLRRDSDRMTKRPPPISAALSGLLAKLPSDHSRRSYDGDWTRYTAWVKRQKLDIAKVRPRHVEAYLVYMQREDKSKATIGHALSVIRECYSALVRDEIMDVNPAREVKTPRIDRAPKTPWLNEEQVKALLDLPAKTWVDRRDHLVVCLLFGLGWRRAEVARMQVENFKNGTVNGTVKGGKEITVGVPTWVTKAVEDWKKFARVNAGSLLLQYEGKTDGLTGDMVYNIVKRAGERAKLPREIVTPHALRRSNITLGGKRGVDLKKRQLAVGHTSQATTERYDRAREASENAPGEVFADMVGGKR